MASRAVSRSVQPPKVLPPPSPFGELLRRSNFASYDPAIRQTYTAPASYIHRGNWGLKRPIAHRKRHSAIVLRNFEEHAQFIEWDKAPMQPDFIKRVEELNIQPTLSPNSAWAHSLGPYADAIDSEFCPFEGLTPRKPGLKTQSDVSSESSPSPTSSPVPENTPITPEPAHRPPKFKGKGKWKFEEQLAIFGNKGKGAYGADSVEPPRAKGESYIQPNIAAMTPRQFEDYLDELRDLRPQFMEYIRQEIKGTRGGADKHIQDPEALKDEQIITKMGAEATLKNLHRYFLGQHAHDKFDAYRAEATEEKEAEQAKEAANAPQPIQGQPHALAGLIYSKPTILETHYTGRAEPGLILQATGEANFHKTSTGYVAVFAGLAAKLDKKSAGNDVRPLLDPYTEEGLNVPITSNASGTGSSIYLKETERDMRIIELSLKAPPDVVGTHVPNQSMNRVVVEPKVVVESAIDQNWRHNPHKPGSMKFNGAMSNTSVRNPKFSPVEMMNRASTWRKPGGRHTFGAAGQNAAKSDPLAASEKSKQNDTTLQILMTMTKKKAE